MSVEDLQLNCTIRSVLARHWIDTHLLCYRSARGNVHVQGELKTLGVPKALEETAHTLFTLESEVRQLRGVRSVQLEFTNWFRNDAGNWECLEKETESGPSSASTGGETPKVIDLPSTNGRD